MNKIILTLVVLTVSLLWAGDADARVRVYARPSIGVHYWVDGPFYDLHGRSYWYYYEHPEDYYYYHGYPQGYHRRGSGLYIDLGPGFSFYYDSGPKYHKHRKKHYYHPGKKHDRKAPRRRPHRHRRH